MAQVIKSVETYGRQDAYRLIGLSRDLPQTADSIAWVIDELNDDQSDRFENYTYNLSMVLLEADLALLLSNESAVMEARCFLPGLRPAIDDRLRMLSWDEATCWRRLEEFCEEGKSRHCTPTKLTWAMRSGSWKPWLARGRDARGRSTPSSARRWRTTGKNPMKWMEPLVVRLAGLAHLDATLPLLINKLLEDGGDLLNEECSVRR